MAWVKRKKTTIYQDTFLLNRAFSDNGLSSGSKIINGDGSSTPKRYYVEALNGEKLAVARLIIYINCGDNDVVAGGYGNLAELTNGIQIFYKKDGVSLDVTDGLPIKSHEDWGRWCFDAEPIGGYGAQNRTPYFRARWTLTKYGKSDGLVLNQGDQLGVIVNDNLSALHEQTIIAEGLHLAKQNPNWLKVIT